MSLTMRTSAVSRTVLRTVVAGTLLFAPLTVAATAHADLCLPGEIGCTAGQPKDPYGPDGFDSFGRDRSGFDRFGYDSFGRDRSGYDHSGYDSFGRDRSGYDRSGYNAFGRDRFGYDRSGHDSSGYARDGYTDQGCGRDGNDKPEADKAACDELRAKQRPSSGSAG